MVPVDSGFPGRDQPAHMQDIREKAADGIRTHDLLHGNYTGLRKPRTANVATCRGFVTAQRAARLNGGCGYAPICSDSGTPDQKFPKSSRRVRFDPASRLSCPIQRAWLTSNRAWRLRMHFPASASERRACRVHGLPDFHTECVGNLLKALHLHVRAVVSLPALDLLFLDFEPLS